MIAQAGLERLQEYSAVTQPVIAQREAWVVSQVQELCTASIVALLPAQGLLPEGLQPEGMSEAAWNQILRHFKAVANLLGPSAASNRLGKHEDCQAWVVLFQIGTGPFHQDTGIPPRFPGGERRRRMHACTQLKEISGSRKLSTCITRGSCSCHAEIKCSCGGYA